MLNIAILTSYVPVSDLKILHSLHTWFFCYMGVMNIKFSIQDHMRITCIKLVGPSLSPGQVPGQINIVKGLIVVGSWKMKFGGIEGAKGPTKQTLGVN